MSSGFYFKSHLIAIVLVVQTGPRPILVYHYPPRPGEANSRYRRMLAEENAKSDDLPSSDEEEDVSDDEPAPIAALAGANLEEDDDWAPPSRAGKRSAPIARQAPEWNDLFGLNAKLLAAVLARGRQSHNKRVELNLNGLTFLGRPYYAYEDGSWRHERKRRSSSKETATLSTAGSLMEMKEAGEILDEIKEETEPSLKTSDSRTELADLEDSTLLDSEDEQKLKNTDSIPSNYKAGVLNLFDDNDEEVSRPQTSTDAMQPAAFYENNDSLIARASKHVPGTAKSPLAMFHISFVLNPPPLEYHQQVNEFYAGVVRELTRALRYEQARSEYVSKEMALIRRSNKRMKGDDPVKLTSLYQELLNQSHLARTLAQLYWNLTMYGSAQVSLPNGMLSLRLPVETSIQSLPSLGEVQKPSLWLSTAPSMVELENENRGLHLSAHFGLLLLVDLKTLQEEIKASDSPGRDTMLRYLQVTKPFKSFSRVSEASGISLPTVNAMASSLINARKARAIPALKQRDTYIMSPNANLLDLDAATSAFGKAFPSLPGLPQILGLLSINRRPYSSIIPTKDHKEKYMDILAWLMRDGWVTQLRSFAWIRVPSHIVAEGRDEESQSERPKESIPAAQQADATSSDGAREVQRHEKPTFDGVNSEGPSSKVGTPPAAIIAKPQDVTREQGQYLSRVSKHVRATKGQEAGRIWDSCVRFFDGKQALESIPPMHGWKRKNISELISQCEEMGLLLKVRHW